MNPYWLNTVKSKTDLPKATDLPEMPGEAYACVVKDEERIYLYSKKVGKWEPIPEEHQPQKGGQPQIRLQCDPSMEAGSYANLALTHFTDTDIQIDFIYLIPREPRAKVIARIIQSPLHAKRLLKALAGSVANYESQFGEISMGDSTPPAMTIN